MRGQKAAAGLFTFAVVIGALVWSVDFWMAWFLGVLLTLCYLPLAVSAWAKLVSDTVRTNAGKPKRNGFMIYALFCGIAFAATIAFVAFEFNDIRTSQHLGTATVCAYFVLPVHFVEFLVTLLAGFAERKKSSVNPGIYYSYLPPQPGGQPNGNGYYPGQNYQGGQPYQTNYPNYPDSNGYYPNGSYTNDNDIYRQ